MLVFPLEDLGLRVYYDPSELEAQDAPLVHYVHRHSFAELHILLENSCTMTVDGDALIVRAGQYCLIAPEVCHASESLLRDFRRLVICFEPLEKKADVQQLFVRRLKERDIVVGTDEMLMQLAEAFPAAGAFSAEQNKALLSLLLSRLAACMECEQKQSLPRSADLDSARAMLMDAHFNRYFANSSGEALLAKDLGVSRRHLDRILHKHYGMGYRQKVARIRLEVACDLLKKTKQPLQRIGERVGYSNPSNFTVFFKREMGMTPSQYRQKC